MCCLLKLICLNSLINFFQYDLACIFDNFGLNIFIISNRYNANNPRGLEIYRAPEVIPQIYETPQEPRENSDIFDKYMFLYNEANAHYELVTFTYYNKQKNIKIFHFR